MPVATSTGGFRRVMTAALAMLTAVVAAGSAATYQVNTLDYVNTTGCTPQKCSLHTAIEAANQNPGPDTIVFAIGSGRQVMQWIPGTAGLPTITDAVVIDGTTQPGFSGTPLVELEGFRIDIQANDCSVRSLSMYDPLSYYPFDSSITIAGNNNVIQGNYLGLDALGNLRGGDGTIALSYGLDNVIGGGDLQNSLTRNLMGGSPLAIGYTSGFLVHGNYIGTDPAGRDLGTPDSANGIYIMNWAEGSIRGNVVAHSGGHGIGFWTDSLPPFSSPRAPHYPYGVHISQNIIVDNLGLGIGFFQYPSGVTANDPGDADTGFNNRLQNFPVLNGAESSHRDAWPGGHRGHARQYRL